MMKLFLITLALMAMLYVHIGSTDRIAEDEDEPEFRERRADECDCALKHQNQTHCHFVCFVNRTADGARYGLNTGKKLLGYNVTADKESHNNSACDCTKMHHERNRCFFMCGTYKGRDAYHFIKEAGHKAKELYHKFKPRQNETVAVVRERRSNAGDSDIVDDWVKYPPNASRFAKLPGREKAKNKKQKRSA